MYDNFINLELQGLFTPVTDMTVPLFPGNGRFGDF